MATNLDLGNFEHPQFFIKQSEKLSALLDAVVAESNAATNPDACIDYLEITEILVELLDQSQYFSVLSHAQLQGNWKEVQSLMGKVQTIQEAVADWDTRVKRDVTASTDDVATTMTGSRKRTRSLGSEIEMLEASKRRRESEYTLVGDTDVETGPTQEVVYPSIERAPAAWWTEPYYD